MSQESERSAKYREMVESPVEPLILRMAIPSVISLLITSVYNLADTYFVGRLGTSATGAVGIVYPLMTLNLALGTAKRIWTARHTENVLLRVQDARETLQLANSYMGELGKGIHELTTIKLSDRKVQEFINEFFPITEDLTDGQRKNNLRLQEDLKARYYNAPDLEWVGKNGWRFINAVSDFATHADPLRKTKNYNENLFLRTAEGNPMIDKAYKMVLAAA